MNAVSVTELTKAVKGHNLFENLTFGLDCGEHLGIIGKNGVGKSTLIHIIAGKIQSDDGQVSVNNLLRVGLLEQDVSFPKNCTLSRFLRLSEDENIRLLNRYEDGEHNLLQFVEDKGIWDIEDRYRRCLSELGVCADLNFPMSKLSGGNRKKAAIARLLAIQPQILLLDEPTNHLDIQAIEWLEKYLSMSQFTVILVTHDRYFLDRVCTRILEIDRCKAYFYTGGYSDFLEYRQERLDAQSKEQDRLANILRREIEWLRRGPQARTGKDSGRKKRILEMQEKIDVFHDDTSDFSSTQRRLGKKILELKNVSCGYENRKIFSDFSLEFIKGQRIGVIGPNGSGKTTLLDTITGKLAPLSGVVDTGVNTVFGYYDQMSENLPLNKTPLEFFSEISENIAVSADLSVTPARFLEMFGFPSSFHRLPISVLSGGEKRRLYLLSCLVNNPNFLVLDEPTNDLDIDTLRKLEQYILDFQGCVISVSHDRAFLDRTCAELIVMPQAERYEGNYSDWKSENDKPETEKEREKVVKTDNRVVQRQAKKGPSFKEKKEFEELEKTIENLEAEKKQLEDFFSSGVIDTDGSKQIRYSDLNTQLEQSYSRWDELARLM